MARKTDDEVRAIVDGFVLRARRVTAHSLFENEPTLQHLAEGGWIAERSEGVESLQRALPNEEVLESLAARVRPLILQKDPVQHGYVLNALHQYLKDHGHTQHAEWCKELKKDWNSVDLKTGAPGYFMSVSYTGEEAPDPVEITDIGLAGAWFYGDLMHADQVQIDKGKAFEIGYRFAAAAVRVAQLAILARDTLSFIKELVDDGSLQLSEGVLDAIPVKVESKDVELTGIYSAAVGTELPGVAGQPLGDEWKSALPGEADGRWAMRIPWGRSDLG